MQVPGPFSPVCAILKTIEIGLNSPPKNSPELSQRVQEATKALKTTLEQLPPLLQRDARDIQSQWDQFTQMSDRPATEKSSCLEKVESKIYSLNRKCILQNVSEKKRPQAPTKLTLPCKLFAPFASDSKYPKTAAAIMRVMWNVREGAYGKSLKELLDECSPAILSQESVMKLLIYEAVANKDKDSTPEICTNLPKNSPLVNQEVVISQIVGDEIPKEQMASVDHLTKLLKEIKLDRKDFEDILKMSQWIIDPSKERILSTNLSKMALLLIKEQKIDDAHKLVSSIPTDDIRKDCEQILASIEELRVIAPQVANEILSNPIQELSETFDLLIETICSHCQLLIKEEKLSEAYNYALTMPAGTDQDETVYDLAKEFIEHKQLEEAFECALTLSENEWKNEILEPIAKKYLKQNLPDKALTVILNIPYPAPRGNLLISLGKHLASGNDYATAFSLIPHIPQEKIWLSRFFKDVLPSNLETKEKENLSALLPKNPLVKACFIDAFS